MPGGHAMLSSAPGVALVLCMQMLLPEEWEMRQPYTGSPRAGVCLWAQSGELNAGLIGSCSAPGC